MKVKGTIRLLNIFTGEVEQKHYKNIDEAVLIYEELNTNMKAAKQAIDDLKRVFGDYLGDDEHQELPSINYEMKWVRGQNLEYRMADIRKYLDEDQIDVVTKPNVTALKKIITEMVEKEELPRGAWKDIEDNAYRKPKKPFVKIQRTKA